MNWIIILAVFALLFVFFSFKMNNFRTRVAFIFIFLGVSFVVLSVLYVMSENKPDLSTFDGWIGSAKTYLSWFVNFF